MQIHELNALSRAPQTGDVLAIDTGTDTAKIDYNALATAIINKLGGDPVTIAHGGTGATTADGACENIGAVKTADVINNLTSGGTTVPLSAEMGKTLNNKIIYQDITTTQPYTLTTGVTTGWISAQTPSGYQPLCAHCISATDSNYGDVTAYIISFVSDILNFISCDSRTLNVEAGMTFRVFYIRT